AGLGALYFTHFPVAEKINTLTQERDQQQKAAADAQQARSKAEGEEKKAKQALDATKKELAEKTATLEAESTRRAEQEKLASKHKQDLDKATEERNDAQQRLAAWNALNMPVETIKLQKEELRKSNE